MTRFQLSVESGHEPHLASVRSKEQVIESAPSPHGRVRPSSTQPLDRSACSIRETLRSLGIQIRALVVGFGITSADRGAHALKGVSNEWRVFSVESV